MDIYVDYLDVLNDAVGAIMSKDSGADQCIAEASAVCCGL